MNNEIVKSEFKDRKYFVFSEFHSVDANCSFLLLFYFKLSTHQLLFRQDDLVRAAQLNPCQIPASVLYYVLKSSPHLLCYKKMKYEEDLVQERAVHDL